MSKIEDLIEILKQSHHNFEEQTFTYDGCKKVANLLQERLDCAEQLYNLNRRVSVALIKEKGLEEADVIALNFELGKIIKKLRGDL